MINVEILQDAKAALTNLTELVTWATDVRMAYAWASSQGGAGSHWRALPLKKVTRAVIGMHFAQTEPAALEALAAAAPGCLRVISDSTGVFHPKLIVGISGTEARAIVGSSNLTGGGFGGNTELNVLLRGSVDESVMLQLVRFVDDAWTHPRAFEPNEEWLANYAEAYQRRPRPPALPDGLLPAEPVQAFEDVDVSWERYVALIRSQERRTLINGQRLRIFDHEAWSYLQEIEEAVSSFHRFGSLLAMPLAERKQVAGLGERSRYLGSMQGAGWFKQLIIHDPAELSGALELIPLSGPVDDDTISIAIDAMVALRGVNLGTVTRLLSTKRPDLFLSLNSGSRDRIRTVFESSPTNPRSYLTLLHRIWALPWKSAPEPEDPHERRIWRARVALVDAVLVREG